MKYLYLCVPYWYYKMHSMKIDLNFIFWVSLHCPLGLPLQLDITMNFFTMQLCRVSRYFELLHKNSYSKIFHPNFAHNIIGWFYFHTFLTKSKCKFCQFCSWNEKYPQIPSKCPQSVCSGSGSQPNMGHCWLRLMTTVSTDKGEKGERGDGTPVESDNQGRRFSFVGENGSGGELRRRASIVKSESS